MKSLIGNYHFSWRKAGTTEQEGGESATVTQSSPLELKWQGALMERFLPRRGWYMLELVVSTHKDSAAPTHLSFECAGHIAPLTVSLSCLSGRVMKRVIWLPGAIDSISLKSVDDSTRIEGADIRVKRLLNAFAKKRMAGRLSKYHAAYQNMSAGDITKSISGSGSKVFRTSCESTKLYGLYQDTFPVHGAAGAQMPVALASSSELNAMTSYPCVDLKPTSDSFTEDALTIHWVTCDFAPSGGGGNMTIFRFVRLFGLFGHKQKIWLHNKSSHKTPESAYEDLVRNYQQTSASIHFINDEPDAFRAATGDIIIATDWQSVWPVLSVPGFKRRFYFVQDHEPSFFAAGGHSLAAEMTYREDLDCICAGPWLEKLMTERYGRWATKFWLAADKSVYYPPDDWPVNAIPRIAFYARSSTSRRAVELGLLALEYLAEQGNAEFHVDLYGSSSPAVSHDATFSWTNHGVLDADELGDLYRACDIGMVFSATNYSLVPQEMMACRLAVLELDGDNTRAVFPDDCVVLAKPHPRHIAEQLAFLLLNQPERQRIAASGCAWAAQFGWEETARDVNTVMQLRLEELGYKKVAAEFTCQAIKVSVVIPTWNGGDLLLKVLDAVGAQKAPWPYEVLVIDSGSNDGSLELMQGRTDIRLHSIPQAEFNHGGTRNLGVEMTSSEYIAFLTQDALPVDEFWLFHLVSALEHDAEAAGAFGRHLPYPEASPFVKRDLHAHFENLGQYPLYLSKDTDPARFESGEQGWRQVLHFYSDNNSCMRRSVWEKIPYPAIDYGEDQVWADQIIKAGYKKVYAMNAVVYHSHDYDEREVFERSRTEALFFKKYFDYTLLDDKRSLPDNLDDLNRSDALWGEAQGYRSSELSQQCFLNASRISGLSEQKKILLIGASGTGKSLLAQNIGYSYMDMDIAIKSRCDMLECKATDVIADDRVLINVIYGSVKRVVATCVSKRFYEYLFSLKQNKCDDFIFIYLRTADKDKHEARLRSKTAQGRYRKEGMIPLQLNVAESLDNVCIALADKVIDVDSMSASDVSVVTKGFLAK